MRGNGYTLFGEGPRKNKVEWGEGSLFAGPLNVMHRHYNGSSKPARLLAITSFPFMLQVFGNLGLVNNLNFQFTDRYNSAPDYFTKTERVRKRWDKTNFVKDIRTAEVVPWLERGGENASIFWDMSGNTILEPHMSEFEVGGYKLGHRHPYEAIILTLNGSGFSLASSNRISAWMGSVSWNSSTKMRLNFVCRCARTSVSDLIRSRAFASKSVKSSAPAARFSA